MDVKIDNFIFHLVNILIKPRDFVKFFKGKLLERGKTLDFRYEKEVNLIVYIYRRIRI